MKRIKFIPFLLILFYAALITIFFLDLQSINVNPSGPFYVGDQISFSYTGACGFVGSARWNFGDGTIRTGSQNNQQFRYRSPGNYTVTVTDLGTGSGVCAPENLAITIFENRSINVSPAKPVAGQKIIFTAINFNTPQDIRWEMGDGTVYRLQNARVIQGGSVVTHTYSNPGNYTVRAFDWNGSMSVAAVSVTISIGTAARRITHTPAVPGADQKVLFEALSFLTSVIDWNFGDGTIVQSGTTYTHRFQNNGFFTVSAKDSTINHPPPTQAVTVTPDIRQLTVSSQEVRVNEEIIVRALNFYDNTILWNFGDGTQETGFNEMRHTYARSGNYTITALDYNGDTQVPKQATVKVIGLNDIVNLSLAEIVLDNHKYYKIVPRNSKHIRAILRMKMRGTGIVSGYWIVDGHNFEYFNEVAYEGEIKEIYTKTIPGLPTIDSGIHTISVRLTRPADPIAFPTLKYFVLPYENMIETISPQDGFIAKEDEIPEFSWKEPRLASKYEIAFSNQLYVFLFNTADIQWINVKTKLKFKPGVNIWNKLNRNKWTYWKVRALDNTNNIVAESDIQDIKVVIATAKISINKVTDLEGKEIKIKNNNINTGKENILVHGSIKYKGDSKYLILRVFSDNELVDQLLFRDVKKEEKRSFETSIPNRGKKSQIVFQVLRSSSPSVIVGIKGMTLKK